MAKATGKLKGNVSADSRTVSNHEESKSQGMMSSPDCKWSWVIAVSCSLLNFFNLAVLRCGSVVFLKTIEHFNVTRTEASWPPSLIHAVCNLSGIVTGYLTRRYGPRKVVLLGSAISTVSVTACYFADNTTKLILLCGICHGFGMGLILPAVAVCLNRWFDQKKVTASGIIYTGNALGSFFFPVIFEFTVNQLGFSGGFLIFGGIMSHGIACSLFIRMPPWLNIDGTQKVRPPTRCPTVERFAHDHPLVQSGNFMKRSVSQHSFDDRGKTEDEMVQKFHEAMRHHIVETLTEVEDEDEENMDQVTTEIHVDTKKSNKSKHEINTAAKAGRRSRAESMLSASPTVTFSVGGPSIYSGTQLRSRRSSAISTSLSMLGPQVNLASQSDIDAVTVSGSEDSKKMSKSPLIFLVGISYILVINCNNCFQTVLLDFAADHGIDARLGVYLISGFAVLDVAGRLSVGFLSDSGLISRTTLIGFAGVLFGVSLNLLPFAQGLWSIMLCCALTGFSAGTSVVLLTVLVGDYSGDLSKISTYIGWMAFITGITGLTRPFLIGYFRDVAGNYNGLLSAMGIPMFFSGVAWNLVTLYERFTKSSR